MTATHELVVPRSIPIVLGRVRRGKEKENSPHGSRRSGSSAATGLLYERFEDFRKHQESRNSG